LDLRVSTFFLRFDSEFEEKKRNFDSEKSVRFSAFVGLTTLRLEKDKIYFLTFRLKLKMLENIGF